MIHLFDTIVPVLVENGIFLVAGRLKPKRFQRIFGYFCSETKVTRVGTRNIPSEGMICLPCDGSRTVQ